MPKYYTNKETTEESEMSDEVFYPKGYSPDSSSSRSPDVNVQEPMIRTRSENSAKDLIEAKKSNKKLKGLRILSEEHLIKTR